MPSAPSCFLTPFCVFFFSFALPSSTVLRIVCMTTGKRPNRHTARLSFSSRWFFLSLLIHASAILFFPLPFVICYFLFFVKKKVRTHLSYSFFSSSCGPSHARSGYPRFELSYRPKYSIQLTLKMQNKNSGVSACVCGTSKTKGMKSGSSLSIKTRPG